jgi:hypothetical protein
MALQALSVLVDIIRLSLPLLDFVRCRSDGLPPQPRRKALSPFRCASHRFCDRPDKISVSPNSQKGLALTFKPIESRY